MKTILILASLLVFTACGQKPKTKLYPIKASVLSTYVNEAAIPASPNLSIEKTIVNNSYPIEIALYSDGRFYYDLPNLGDGRGTWTLSKGVIKLKAKRTLFDMEIDVLGTDAEANSLSIQFSDRFGPKTLHMMNVNI